MVSFSQRCLAICAKDVIDFAGIPEEEIPDISAKPGPTDKSVPWPLRRDADGLPILPAIKDRTLPQIKQIVRSFLSLTYRLFPVFHML
jgi:hypothetical protein